MCILLQEKHREAQQNEELCKQNLTAANKAYDAAQEKSEEARIRLHTNCCQFNEDREHIWVDNHDRGEIHTFYPKKCITCETNGASALRDGDNTVHFKSEQQLKDERERTKKHMGAQFYERW